tara:strand:+ start:223 stop:468 length:246 start_codon:yes stop_codon:yes gene_type:complete
MCGGVGAAARYHQHIWPPDFARGRCSDHPSQADAHVCRWSCLGPLWHAQLQILEYGPPPSDGDDILTLPREGVVWEGTLYV